MKKLAFVFATSLLLFACGGEQSTEDTSNETSDSTEVVVEEEEIPEPPKSPRKMASGVTNGVQVDIDYGSPSVRDRVIWGELVPYDKIWRAGANETTAITFGSDVNVEGNPVSAGTYALFIIPKDNTYWTVVLNEEWSKEEHGVWGAYDHDPEKDVLRFDVMPAYTEDSIEELNFMVQDDAIGFEWEKVIFGFEVTPQ